MLKIPASMACGENRSGLHDWPSLSGILTAFHTSALSPMPPLSPPLVENGIKYSLLEVNDFFITCLFGSFIIKNVHNQSGTTRKPALKSTKGTC